MAGYVQIGDIKGESVDANHKDWINLLSVSQSVSRPMRAGISGSTRQRASADLGDIICVKEVDASTPKLIQAICDGRNYPEVKIDLECGDGVKIKEGPFENFDGIVDEVYPEKGLVRVIVTIFSRPTPVELEYWQVEPI